jgi:predicted NBD/HSP70 family sugar kinase
MEHFVGLDVSVKETSVCVVDAAGKVILEQKVPTEPADIITLLLARRELLPDWDRGRAAVALAGQCVDGG